MSENVRDFELSDSGSLYTWSVVHVAEGWNVPYIAGYVDLPQSVRVLLTSLASMRRIWKWPLALTLTTTVVGADRAGR